MKLNKTIIIVLIGILVISALPVGLISAQEADDPEAMLTEPRSINPVSSFGMQIHHITNTSVLDKAEAAGIHWVRYNNLLWSQVQPEKDLPVTEWNWNQNIDNFLIDANNRGWEVILGIRSTPEWAQKYEGWLCGPIKQENFIDFANFVDEVIQKYSTEPYNVKYFEIWNEPDDGRRSTPPTAPYGCWAEDEDYYGGGEYYGKMLKTIYPLFENSPAQLVLGGLLMPCDPRFPDSTWPESCPTDPRYSRYPNRARFFEGILKECGAAPCFDVISYHGFNFYQTGMSPIQSERLSQSWRASGGPVVGKLDYLRATMDKYNVPQKPVLLTEAGLIDFHELRHIKDAEGNIIGDNPDFDRQAFEEAKAFYILWLYTRNIALDIMGTTWYHFNNGWHLSGLLESGEPQPAYLALKELASVLDGATFQGEINPGGIITGFAFDLPTGRDDTTLWMLFPTYGSDQQVRVDDGHRIFDHQGNEILIPSDGLVSFNHPIYIEFSGKEPELVLYNIYLPLILR